jgi:hypothetical protein
MYVAIVRVGHKSPVENSRSHAGAALSSDTGRPEIKVGGSQRREYYSYFYTARCRRLSSPRIPNRGAASVDGRFSPQPSQRPHPLHGFASAAAASFLHPIAHLASPPPVSHEQTQSEHEAATDSKSVAAYLYPFPVPPSSSQGVFRCEKFWGKVPVALFVVIW